MSTKQYRTTRSCPNPRSASDSGANIKAPSAGPAKVPGPPRIAAAMGIMVKSTAKRDNPAKPGKVRDKGACKAPYGRSNKEGIDLYASYVHRRGQDSLVIVLYACEYKSYILPA